MEIMGHLNRNKPNVGLHANGSKIETLFQSP